MSVANEKRLEPSDRQDLAATLGVWFLYCPAQSEALPESFFTKSRNPNPTLRSVDFYICGSFQLNRVLPS